MTPQPVGLRDAQRGPDASRPASSDAASTLALAQAAYYVPTGLWSLLDVESFQAVTGPKADLWLVKTVGALVAVVGGALGLAGLRRRVTPEMRFLAVGSALGLAAIDVVYVARRRIAPIYLADAAAELGLAAAWASAGEWPRGADDAGEAGD